MTYPTMEQVDAASRYQLCQWWRFLPSPGTSAVASANFSDVLEKEVAIMNRISERYKETGGMTPEISKQLGW